MPVFSLNDSGEEIMEQARKSPLSVPTPKDNRGQRPPVLPGSDNIQELVKNLSQRMSYLNGNPLPPKNSLRGVDRLILDRQRSRDWEELELSMEILDDLMGKSPDHQKSPFLHDDLLHYQQTSDDLLHSAGAKPSDNSCEGFNLSDDLDESFVPLKEGFRVEGGTTPAKKTTQTVNDGDCDREVSSTDDLMARFQKLKQETSKMEQKLQYSQKSCS